jgi:hypothetical protein
MFTLMCDIFHIFSLFNLHFLHIFHIFSLFNLLFFHICLILVSPVLKSSFRMFYAHHHKLVNGTEYMGVSDDNRYVSFVVDTQTQYLSSVLEQDQTWLNTRLLTWETRPVQIVEHELFIFAEYLGSSWFIVVFLLLNLYISVFCVALTTCLSFCPCSLWIIDIDCWVPSLVASNHSYAIFHNFEARRLLNSYINFIRPFTEISLIHVILLLFH